MGNQQQVAGKGRIIRSGALVVMVMMASLVVGRGHADDRSIGIGIILFEPTGLSVKKWVDDSHAIDFALGWSLISSPNSLYVHMDYLWFGVVYYGLGARFQQLGSGSQIGLRVPIGVNILVRPLEVFAEIGPIMNLVPNTSFSLGGGLGARLYF